METANIGADSPPILKVQGNPQRDIRSREKREIEWHAKPWGLWSDDHALDFKI